MIKRIFAITCLLIITINAIYLPAFAEEPELDAKSAVLMDMSNSMVMFRKNSDSKIQPAGFTKIVTAIVVLENCDDLSQVIVAPADTIAACDFSFGNMGVLAGEELSAAALLEGMLIYDAAEAAEVLAGFTFGNYDKFITAMNDIAQSAGAESTCFKNAGGYYDDEQYTTAEDIAKIALYAMGNEEFARIVGKDSIEIAPTNKYKETRNLSNTNMFVGKARSGEFYSSRVFGVKTSNMKEHGYGVCAAFENSLGRFLCVTAGGSGAHAAHTDAQTLRRYTEAAFAGVKVAEKDDIIEEIEVPSGNPSHVLLKTASALTVCLPKDYDKSKIYKMTTKDANLSAPVAKDEVLGRLSVSYDGTEVGSVELVAYDDVKFSAGRSVRHFFGKVVKSPLFYLPVAVLVLCFAAAVYKANRKKMRKRK